MINSIVVIEGGVVGVVYEGASKGDTVNAYSFDKAGKELLIRGVVVDVLA